MTSSEEPPPAAALAEQLRKLRETTAQTSVVLSAHRGQLRALGRRMDNAGLDTLAGRFEQLDETVRAMLEAAAPRGPAAPLWDRPGDAAVPDAQLAEQRAAVRAWVDGVLRPGYVRAGCYTLADCWERHPVALRELGVLAVWWQFVYGRARPDAALALEFHDRWLPGTMRRIAEATQHCDVEHFSAG